MSNFENTIEHLKADFDAIQMVRSPFVLERLVVGAKDHPSQAWVQCVLELQIKYNAIRRAQIKRQMIIIEIEQLKAGTNKIELLEAELKGIDLEEQDQAEIGARREFEALYKIYLSFGRRWTREQLNEAQPEYWQKRLMRQAGQDLLANGMVSQGNQEVLRQIGMSVPNQISEIEQNYLAVGNKRLLLVIATEEKAVNGLPILDKLVIPSGIEYKIQNIYDTEIAEAYNEAGMIALREKVDYLLIVEDDIFPPDDGLIKLLKSENDVISGWYLKRQSVVEGAPIILQNGIKQRLDNPDDSMVEVYTLPQGFTLIKTEILKRLAFPWFVTTNQLSQDDYFSRLCYEAGIKLWCDTSVRCTHAKR